jgi:drug/metabolite transporter (DMT)-like permease
MNSATRPLGIAALLLATSAWGSLFLVGKSVLGHIDPVWFTVLRYTLASVVFAVLLFARGNFPWRKLRQHARRLGLLGFLGYGVFSVLVLVGLSHSLPSHGAVIMATMPLTTQLVRWAIDGERPASSAFVATPMALAGVLAVSGLLGHHESDAAATHATLLPDLVTLVGTLGWVAYSRGVASLPGLDVIEYSALTALASWPLLLGGAILATLAGVATVPTQEDIGHVLPALVYIGAVPSVMAVLAYNFGVRTLGVIAGTAFLNFVPVSALGMSTLLGAKPSLHELIGVAMVIAGLLIHTATQQRRAAASARQVAPAPRLCTTSDVRR